MIRRLQRFIHGLALDGISATGVVLVHASLFSFLLFEFFSLLGVIQNAYAGLVVYLGFPALFLLGLFLIPLGWWLAARKRGIRIAELRLERFDQIASSLSESGSPLFRTIALLTLVNVLVLSFAGMRMLHHMDSAHFCGTACHSVMNPEWTVYQASPHARVACVECHVGEGLGALINSKINGAWQMVSATFDLYERPIPTPVHNLRPARETCEKCHWPEFFLGKRMVNRVHFAQDSASTPSYTTLLMKVGSGQSGVAGGAHWHVAAENQIRYRADASRNTVYSLAVTQADGSLRHFSLDGTGSHEETEQREMDCVDCHNRATHIYERAERALDDRLQRGLISRELPGIKSIALQSLLGSYTSEEQAMRGIELGMRNRMERAYPQQAYARSAELDQALSTVQEIWSRNIHPGMNIGWGAYPSHLGHRDGTGCFRCHNPRMKDEQGKAISMECTLCHSLLAVEAEHPLAVLETQMDHPEAVEREELRQELLRSLEP